MNFHSSRKFRLPHWWWIKKKLFFLCFLYCHTFCQDNIRLGTLQHNLRFEHIEEKSKNSLKVKVEKFRNKLTWFIFFHKCRIGESPLDQSSLSNFNPVATERLRTRSWEITCVSNIWKRTKQDLYINIYIILLLTFALYTIWLCNNYCIIRSCFM